MSNRRTALVVSPYESEYGPARVLEQVARGVALAGLRPVCVVRPHSTVTPGLDRLDPLFRYVPALRTVPRTLNPQRLARFLREHLAAAAEIEVIVREEEAAIVYSISEATFAGGLAARRAGVPSAVHVIGMSIKRPRWTARPYIGLLDRLSSRFVACSSAAAEMLRAFGIDESKIDVAHNAVAATAIAAMSDVKKLADTGPRIGMIAAYDPRKGHELFVKSAAEIAGRHPTARFYIIGGVLETQPESAAFERAIRRLIHELALGDRIEQVGYVPAPDVYAWVRAMDVVVVPSKTEAFAHVVPEAMACGRPVVATAIEGNLDAFVHGHSGLYADQTPARVAAAVETLLREPAKAAAIGEAARDRALLFFDERVTLAAIADTVQELVGEDGR